MQLKKTEAVLTLPLASTYLCGRRETKALRDLGHLRRKYKVRPYSRDWTIVLMREKLRRLRQKQVSLVETEGRSRQAYYLYVCHLESAFFAAK